MAEKRTQGINMITALSLFSAKKLFGKEKCPLQKQKLNFTISRLFHVKVIKWEDYSQYKCNPKTQ